MTALTDQIRNGVDTQQMYGTLDAIKADASLGRFQFRVANEWLGGAHNRSTIRSFYGAGGEDTSREAAFTLDAGEPASARKVQLTRVESRVEGDMDVRGCLGISDEVRNGFERIRVSFAVEGDAPAEKLRELVARAKARSAVYDIVANGVPTSVELT